MRSLLLCVVAAYCLTDSQPAWADVADLEKDLQTSLEQSGKQVSQAARKLERGLDASPEIARLKVLSENIRITHMLMEERFRLRDEKVKSLGSKAIERQQAMTEGYKAALTEYLSLIESLPADGSVPQSVIRDIQSLLEKILPKKKRPIIGSLPYKHLNLPASEPSTTPAITPAYKGGNKTVSPDDTKAYPEAPISKEIAALAQSLNWSPVSIYEFVKNNVETEWYWGCMKGAEETLRQKSGNDCDQALLLAGLLRASGFPTRLVRGSMEFFAGDGKPMERVKNLTGIEDPATIAEFFQKAGIPFKPVIAGGTISNFQVEHVWVESQIPYANYRGAIIDDLGKTWLGLDTSIKTTDYVHNNAKDILQEQGVSGFLPGLRDEYLGAVQSLTPLEYLKARIENFAPDTLYSEFLLNRTLPAEYMKILPDSMQFLEKGLTGEYTGAPDDLLHTAKFTATATNKTELFTVTLPLYRLSNQQIAITYEPETVEDQEIINSYGGLDNTPSYLVRLRPVLTINKERVVVAQDGLPMGSEYDLTIELVSPKGTEAIANALIVGNLTVIGVSVQKAVTTPSPLAGEGQSDSGEAPKDAERLLYEAAQHYMDRWNRSEDELASLLHLTLARPLPTVVIIGGVIDVTYLLDQPHGFTWKGVYVDADLRAVEAVYRTLDLDDRNRLFMQLSSLQGSILENRIFEDDFQVESISTAKLIQISQMSGNQLLTIDKANIDSILPTLHFDENIKEDIVNSVNQQYSIRIPQAEITYHDWSGIGYIKENTETGESGWMLSGMIAGGSTVDATWLNNLYLQQTLRTPYAGSTNRDPLAGVRLFKIPATDKQDPKTVGTALLTPFAAVVLDGKNLPVVGATVRFRVIAGGGTIQCLNQMGAPAGPPSETDCESKASNAGIAKARLTVGVKTEANADYMKLNSADENYTQIGLNLVTASAQGHSGSIALNSPFEAYGKPDVPAKIEKVYPLQNVYVLVNNPAGTLHSRVTDTHGNPVSNVPLTFMVQPAVSNNPATDPLPADYRNIGLYTRETCTNSYPVAGDCETTSTLPLKTHYYGAQVDTILGNTLNTHYTVNVSAAGLEPVTFDLYSQGARKSANDYVPSVLMLWSLGIVNEKGEPVNAAKAGTELKAPLMAKMFMLQDEYDIQSEQCTRTDDSGQTVTFTGYSLVSRGTFSIRPVNNGVVSFKAIQGTASSTQNIGNGQYLATYQTGTVPAKNIIEADGNAEITVPEVFGVDGPGGVVWKTRCLETPVVNERTATLEHGQYAVFDQATHQLIPVYAASIKPTYTAYGVKADLVIQPSIVLLNNQGYTKADTTLTYTIQPSDYRALRVDLDASKSVSQNTPETWEGYVVADTSQGQGTVVLVAGTPFDISKIYKEQVVLNRGTDMEVRSDKVLVKAAQFLITKPTTTEKILIKNTTDGTPKMPKLTAQVELKGTGLSQNELDLSGKEICWQFKVEYRVRITRSNADYRSRDGLECDAQGLCEGKDGYFIPALDVTHVPTYKCWLGPTFIVDDIGNQGARWDDNNFGGGMLTITANTNSITGESATDTFTGAIQGMKNGNNSSDALNDVKFKEYVCKYLDMPMGVANYQSDILDVLGHNRVFRIIAYHESAHNYGHFERLGDGGWNTLASVLDYSADYVFPKINKGTKYCIGSTVCSDGGFGVMQLTTTSGSYLLKKFEWDDGSTEYLPGYQQIWNWKKNVDGGVLLVKEKMGNAKKYLKKHYPQNADSKWKSILRTETYHRYGPTYKNKDEEYLPYWEWDKLKGEWVFSTDTWFYADTLREIEDKIDGGQFSLLPGWKYDGEQ